MIQIKFTRLFLILSLAILTSCSKDKIELSNNIENIFDDGMKISSKGYLSFKKTEDIVRFGKLLFSNEKNSVISKLKAKGFKSRSEFSNMERDPNSIYSLIFNQDGLLQVDEVILKISDDDKFLYTLKEEISNAENFNKLVNEIYDGLIMNKINVDRKLFEEFNLIDFSEDNPFGILEPLYAGERRPMFGTITSEYCVTDPAFYNTGTGQCQQCTNCFKKKTTYVFWIGFPEDPEFVSQSCSAVNTCR